GRAFDRQPLPRRDDFALPAFSLARYECLMAWDHLLDQCWLIQAENGDRRSENRGNSWLELAAQDQRQRVTPLRSPVTELRSPTRDFTPDDYFAAVSRVVRYVLDGDIFQANLSQRFTAPFDGDPLALYSALRRRAP